VLTSGGRDVNCFILDFQVAVTNTATQRVGPDVEQSGVYSVTGRLYKDKHEEKWASEYGVLLLGAQVARGSRRLISARRQYATCKGNQHFPQCAVRDLWAGAGRSHSGWEAEYEAATGKTGARFCPIGIEHVISEDSKWKTFWSPDNPERR
jgi:hypothetical protein